MEAEHCLEWEFSGILHSAKNIIAIYRCCFSDQTTSIPTIIYEDVTGSWKIITSKNKFETSVGLTHWDLAPYLHASFPLQDSFAKCSPSWYDVHSMKASSANGDAWFEKLWDEYILRFSSDEPDPKWLIRFIKDILNEGFLKYQSIHEYLGSRILEISKTRFVADSE